MKDFELPKVSGNMERSIADLERACLVLIAEEQEKINPNNALIATLSDSVRMGREYCFYMQADNNPSLKSDKLQICKKCGNKYVMVKCNGCDKQVNSPLAP